VGPVLAKDAVGAWGERVATRHLEASGMLVVARNWRCPTGELDIVGWDGDVLVVVEVKTRRGARFGAPLEAVTPAKAARLRRLAFAYVAAHDLGRPTLRIDCIGVTLPARGAPEVVHLRGVC
jgi:putative endonuclease